MKKFGLLISFILLATQLVWGQPIIEENFNYATGVLTSVSANWTESPTGSTDIEVISGNLSFTNYPSSGIGNGIVLNGGASGRSGVIRSFTSQSAIGSTVYFSFLLNIISTIDMGLNTSDGDYFFNLRDFSLSPALRAYIYVKQGTNSTKYSIGLAKSSSTSLTWYSNELDVGSTYLVVVSYSFISGTGNDAVKLWINPNLSGTEPSADINITSGTDATDLANIQFRQNPLSGDMNVDGIRVANAWSQAPLPVELSSFSASVVGNAVKLNWKTETEVNNYGFDIERILPQPLPKEGAFGTPLPLGKGQGDGLWTKIGFVNGNGNSNSPKSYSFEDKSVLSGKYSYRLKQIDNDGQFEYSKTIEVDLGAPKKFELSQNYPNPFNPTTTIRFSLPDASLNPSQGGTLVKLTVYNVLGQQVAVLVNDILEAGVHTINFNASELNSGIYIYKLEAGSFVQTRKMTLIK